MTSRWTLIAASGLILLLTYPLRAIDTPVPDWDAPSAARYLDARMDTWWRNAKVLKTGEGEARCLSCHTALPYALARPALRRALGETTPTSHELQIVATVKRRVEAGSSRQPYYDHNEDKKVESRGVEAVVNALILSQWNVAEGSTDADAVRMANMDAAFAELWAAQREDGAWPWLNFGLEPYESPDAVFHGATLAAIAAGTVYRADSRSAPPPPHRRESGGAAALTATSASEVGLLRLRRYLGAQIDGQRLFNGAWALLAAARLDEALTDGQRMALAGRLKAQQRQDGGWSLADLGAWHWNATAPFVPPGKTDQELLAASDGYATGLVVYALRQSGLPSDDSAITRGQSWLRTHRLSMTDDAAAAPWRAYSLNFDREHGGAKGEPWRRLFMSDLATSFAVLALVE